MGVIFLDYIALLIAKIACCGAGILAMTYIGWLAIQDYKERFEE